MCKPGISMRPIISFCGSPTYQQINTLSTGGGGGGGGGKDERSSYDA